ncbi:hypothetical protein C0995_006789, partial [Termitomyces sp. Mi166
MKLELLLSNVEYIMWEFFGFPYILSVYRTIEMWATRLLAFAQLVTLSISTPPGFPLSGNGLWFNTSANVWAKEWLPVGNGYLAAMVPGGTTYEATQLNIESLWSGGPFSDPSYNGGNKQPNDQFTTAQVMDDIRQQIFRSSTGDISSSYAGAGYLISRINTTGTVSNYGRYLDLDEGIARTIWTQLGITYVRQETGLPAPNITCLDSNTLRVRGTIEPDGGMIYEILARLQTVPVSDQSETTQCIQYPVLSGFPANATLQVKAGTTREAWISWVGDTQYSMDGGSSDSSYSFRGPDPHDALLGLISSPTLETSSFSSILSQHVADYKTALTDKFSLSLGQTARLDVPTDVIKAAYQIDVGDRYLEWLLFNYGRYMLISSARGLLPANLQGKWANGYASAWSADSNINIQMNYWSAEMTNLDVTIPLFNYFEKTWAPRGAYTAQVLYNISRGWVTHNEMNIFGHTGMKGPGDTASWSDYPESNAWMMVHVWDHFDYTNDVAWWKSQGWPLIKGVASFHLDKLIPDLYFNDSSLVVSPCNSPEQPLITFGCAHAQQLIWQLFNAVEKGFDASGDTDTAFLAEVMAKRAQMDKGIHIGSWGQLQEWKVDRDSPTDTHRHLSHLIGLYPGYAVTGYNPSLQGKFTKQQVIDAATVSLIHRGN